MKKIICLLLVVACATFMFACGGDSFSEKDFFGMIEESEPTGITVKTRSTRPNGVSYDGYYKTTITEVGFVFDYEYQQRNEQFVEGESSVETVKGQVTYQDGRYIVDGESVAAAPNVAYMNIKLDLTADNVGDYTASKDKKSITSTIGNDKVKAIFGTEIDADTAEIKVTTNGTYLTKVDLTYTTSDGTAMYVEIGYVYIAAPAAE